MGGKPRAPWAVSRARRFLHTSKNPAPTNVITVAVVEARIDSASLGKICASDKQTNYREP
jgi:hypothetical protein